MTPKQYRILSAVRGCEDFSQDFTPFMCDEEWDELESLGFIEVETGFVGMTFKGRVVLAAYQPEK